MSARRSGFIIFSLVVPLVTTIVLPRRSSMLLMFDDFCEHLDAGNEGRIGERDLLLAIPGVGGRTALEVDLASSSAGIRLADVTGTNFTSRRGSFSSVLIASATLRQRSTE